MDTFLKITEQHYKILQEHLYPGDDREAVAIALCGRAKSKDSIGLLVHEILPIPYNQCAIREPDFIQWNTEIIVPLIEKAMNKGMSIVKIHCHPGGGRFFSKTDDFSDRELFDSIYGWIDDNGPHGSIIMLPDGELFGRFIQDDLTFLPIEKIVCVGSDIIFWYNKDNVEEYSESFLRNSQLFGEKTVSTLSKLRIGVVGCSGTGSPLIEQLFRLGVGELHLVDDDIIEEKNLNRIVNSRRNDAKNKKLKVEVLKEAIEATNIGTKVVTHACNLYDSIETIRTLSTLDIIFGCVDSIDGRFLINQIATYYLIPYFDLGVKLIADNYGGIDYINGTVHYLEPGQSLMDRKVFDSEGLRSANLKRTNKEEYNRQLEEKYIKNINVESPAVIHINMLTSSLAADDMLARLHNYRADSNKENNVIRFDLVNKLFTYEVFKNKDSFLNKSSGRGDILPLVGSSYFA